MAGKVRSSNASITVKCVTWLNNNRQACSTMMWKTAMSRFNTDNNCNIAHLTFRNAAKELGIKFKQTQSSAVSASQDKTSLMAKIIEAFLREIEHQIGISEKSIGSTNGMRTALRMVRGKASTALIEEHLSKFALNNSDDDLQPINREQPPSR